VTEVFSGSVNEILTLMGFYVTCNDNVLLKFGATCRSYLQGSSNPKTLLDPWRWDRQVLTKRRCHIAIVGCVNSRREQISLLDYFNSLEYRHIHTALVSTFQNFAFSLLFLMVNLRQEKFKKRCYFRKISKKNRKAYFFVMTTIYQSAYKYQTTWQISIKLGAKWV
jgi:hypothetical protein